MEGNEFIMGIKEFMQKFENDKEFAAKYQELGNLDAALIEAKKDGYSITREELEAEFKKSGELSDEALEGAAGGATGKTALQIGKTVLPIILEMMKKEGSSNA